MTTILILSIVFVILFLTVFSILGLNVRRTELGKEFVNDVIYKRYSRAFDSLSFEYQQRFMNNIDVFTLACRFFEEAVFTIPAGEGSGQFRLHPQGPFFLKKWEGKKSQITVVILDTDRPQYEVFKRMLLLYLKPVQARSGMKQVDVALLFQDGRWTINDCCQGDTLLGPLDYDTLITHLKTLSSEDLIKYGNSYYDLGDRKRASLFYQSYYKCLTDWDETTRITMDRLADYWIKAGNMQGDVLKTQLDTMSIPPEKATAVSP